METRPITYEQGDELFVWCIDDRGALRPISAMAFGQTEPDDALRKWGWRYATRAEVATLPRHS